jgi:hypothetical protein
MEEEQVEKDISRMFCENKLSLDEELAFFLHRFNSDLETIECMPAFENHLNELFPNRKKE